MQRHLAILEKKWLETAESWDSLKACGKTISDGRLRSLSQWWKQEVSKITVKYYSVIDGRKIPENIVANTTIP